MKWDSMAFACVQCESTGYGFEIDYNDKRALLLPNGWSPAEDEAKGETVFLCCIYCAELWIAEPRHFLKVL